MAVDKPTIQYSLSQLRKEVTKPDAFKIALSGSKIITFPDVNAMDSEASDELLEKIENPKTAWEVLDEWLSPADNKTLRAEKLSRAELLKLIHVAGGYYRSHYDKLGEDDASAS
jgi:hypothetical protein